MKRVIKSRNSKKGLEQGRVNNGPACFYKEIEKQKTEPTEYYNVNYKDRLNEARGASDERSEVLPQCLFGPDLRLDVPFVISHNGEMLIASGQ